MRFSTISSYLFAFCLAGLGLASCTKDDVPDPSEIFGGGKPSDEGLKVSDFTGERGDDESVAERTWTCINARIGNSSAGKYIEQTITMNDDQGYTSDIDVFGQSGSWGVAGKLLMLNGNTTSSTYYVVFANDRMRWTEVGADGDAHYFEFSR